MSRDSECEVAAVGVAEHGNAAVLVTVSGRDNLLDRRRIELTGSELPTHPHHHEGSWAVGRYLNTPGARPVSLADALALVERVREAATRGAHQGLDAVARAVAVPIVAIAIRVCPELPPTVEERIAEDIDAFLHALGKSVGPPWQAAHKLAAAAAIATVRRVGLDGVAAARR